MTPIKPRETPDEVPLELRLLDGIDDWLLLIGRDHNVIRVNSAIRRIHGALEGDLDQAVCALGGSRGLAGRIRTALDDEDEIPGFECRLQGPGGGERRYICSGWRMPPGEGWLLRFREIPVAGDYEAVVEHTGTATILIEDDGTISLANTEFERLSGYSRREIVGVRRLTDFISSEDERRRIMGYHILRRSDPAAAPKNYSFSFVDRAGNHHIVEATIGMVPGTARSVISLLDVTGRRRMEEALRESEERLNLALAAANDGLVDWDVRTGAIYYSPRSFTMLGYEPGAFTPTISTVLALIHPEDRGRVEEALTGMIAGERDRLDIEFRMRSASGDFVYVLNRLQVVSHGAGGEPLRIVGTHSDITERKEAERELRIKDMAIASSLDAISLTDLDDRITYVNRASLAMHGWDREEEIIGQPASMLWADPEETERVIAEFRRDGTWSGEAMGRRRDGSTFPMQLALSAITDETGAKLGSMGSWIDITRRKLAEQELWVRDMAISSSLTAFTIVDLDGRLTYTNQAFLSLWGYTSAAGVLGKRVTELWQDNEKAEEILRTILETGRYTGERVGRRLDGTKFYAMFSGNLIRDEAGTPICLAASFTDITDLKRAEAEIQAHNRELSILNQIIGVSTSTTEIAGALEDVLAATIALLDLRGGGIYLIEPDRQSARLICTRGLPEGFPPQACIPDITVPPYADLLVTGEPLFLDDHPHLRYPGEEGEAPYPCSAIPIVASGRIIGSLNVVPRDRRQFTDADRSLLAAIGREIGSSIERTLLIRQLEGAEREANLYLDILSHDIRNAENISSLYIDILIDMLEGDAKEHAQKIRSSIRKSIEIVRNVSTIRRIHHESVTLAPVDLDGVIRDEIGVFSEINFNYEGTDLVVVADPLLPEVFTNLIGNAVKFGGPAVEITIRVEESGNDVLISVEDTGPGISDEMKDTVFMRFGKNRIQKSGQGLGLSIVRMLVERYGGTIRSDDRVSGCPGCGAAFRFTLKRA
ncbi:Adaptive-response sensory-kinase SasA [anaerobic digester metagenome]